MAIQITIDGTDRTRLVDPMSMMINNVISQEVDTALFNIKKFGDRSFAPSVGQEVIISLDGSKLFAGRISVVNEVYSRIDYVLYGIQCVDYTRDLDKKLIIESYENQSVDAIIADISSSYFDGLITTNNVDCPIEIKYIAFNYEQGSSVLRQLAEITNYDWYIDYDRDLHFFAKSDNSAPFGLTDTNGKYVYESLKLKKDISPVRNTVIVRGGEYLGDPFTVEALGDGTQNVFGTEYKFANLQVAVTGQIKNIGVDPLEEIDTYDGLHNFQEKFVRFRDDKIPTAGSSVKIMGNPYLPVIVKLRDNSSIANFSATENNNGIYEYLIVDKSIKSKEGARQRARAELLAYSSTLVEGEFVTYTDGLRSGQKINVQSDLRGIDADYIINKVTMMPVGTVSDDSIRFLYVVSLVTTRSFDHIALLRKLLEEKNKEIVIAEDEVLDQIENADETLIVGESVTFTAEQREYVWASTAIPETFAPIAYWDKGDFATI